MISRIEDKVLKIEHELFKSNSNFKGFVHISCKLILSHWHLGAIHARNTKDATIQFEKILNTTVKENTLVRSIKKKLEVTLNSKYNHDNLVLVIE